MGSTNPLVVLPGAIQERAEAIAQGLAASVLMGVGQFCTKPGLIFTIGWSSDALVDGLAKSIAGAAASAMLNQNLRDNFCARSGKFAKTPGVKTLVNGSSGDHAHMSASLWETDGATWMKNEPLHEEAFGPGALVVRCRDELEVLKCLDEIDGSLTGTLHIGANDDQGLIAKMLGKMEAFAGRVLFNGYPTGVEVCNAIVHGGPYPATTDANSTSVGSAAIRRWVRMICWQDVPDALLAAELQNANPLKIERLVNGVRTREAV
jgi:NADP-dependent aldehyde dehydrogenase